LRSGREGGEGEEEGEGRRLEGEEEEAGGLRRNEVGGKEG